MFGSIFNTYHGAPILCCTTTDFGIFWCCSWDFWSCIYESPEYKLQWQFSMVTITWNKPAYLCAIIMKMCELSVSVLCKTVAHLTSYCELLCITQSDNLARNCVFLECDRPPYDASPGSKMRRWFLLNTRASVRSETSHTRLTTLLLRGNCRRYAIHKLCSTLFDVYKVIQ